ncbi:LacI family transcriptional regulator [Actinobacteria bacterium YIM 96077]|uniref:LacI family transcriptional regulator n=1 Tax=Phytoactinopolyspora halophila TaxID=1981511 RepID=A0A329QGJ9_9ACTN|nr:LacI family DNA-binding transcriptional regulator [Phytoactinopolyspora halophila]AYY13456.1 LacI family transcriptional regulator [Actinobacteria bacterium YIM 96077]RAW10849.1 LacI family transcriptional regulator [Phytoactinopolyspora halophila]
MTKPPTIADIAKRAGLSKGAVSYALNGRPGVSEATRQRVLKLAAEMNWHPNSAARALSGARAGAVGLALARPASVLGIEPFFMRLISGIETALSAASVALHLQIVSDHEAEIAIYRRWWAEQRIDGAFIADLWVGDSRLPVLEQLDLPAVIIGGPAERSTLPGVWVDDSAGMAMIVEYLAALGHRRLAHVSGLPSMLHTQQRQAAFDAAVARLGLDEPAGMSTDYSAEQSSQVTRRLLSLTPRPTAIIYDNDVMAVAGTSVAHEMGVDVPGQVSIVAWEDSVLCHIVHPPLSALSRDVVAHGARAAEHLLAKIGGEDVDDYQVDTPALVTRGSTGRAPR